MDDDLVEAEEVPGISSTNCRQLLKSEAALVAYAIVFAMARLKRRPGGRLRLSRRQGAGLQYGYDGVR